MGKFADIGKVPSILSFVCAALTVIVPLLIRWLLKMAKQYGNPPWREEEEYE